MSSNFTLGAISTQRALIAPRGRNSTQRPLITPKEKKNNSALGDIYVFSEVRNALAVIYVQAVISAQCRVNIWHVNSILAVINAQVVTSVPGEVNIWHCNSVLAVISAQDGNNAQAAGLCYPQEINF